MTHSSRYPPSRAYTLHFSVILPPSGYPQHPSYRRVPNNRGMSRQQAAQDMTRGVPSRVPRSPLNQSYKRPPVVGGDLYPSLRSGAARCTRLTSTGNQSGQMSGTTLQVELYYLMTPFGRHLPSRLCSRFDAIHTVSYHSTLFHLEVLHVRFTSHHFII